MPAPTNNSFTLSPELELERILSLKQAAELQSTSIDTLKRRHAGKIIRLSPRRKGIRLRDALMLRQSEPV
jgi:hypothetical protein